MELTTTTKNLTSLELHPPAKFYTIKNEIRILGIDDAPFRFKQKENVLVVGVIFRGGSFLDGVVSTEVRVDGKDATDKVIELIKKLRFKDVRILMSDGLSLGGFNMLDIHRIFKTTGIPVIVVTRDLPDMKKIKAALMHLPDFEWRWDCILKAGKPVPVTIRDNKHIYIQFAGLEEKDASEIVKLSATRSLLPEPIRVAHLIAQGIILGQSRGKA